MPVYDHWQIMPGDWWYTGSSGGGSGGNYVWPDWTTSSTTAPYTYTCTTNNWTTLTWEGQRLVMTDEGIHHATAAGGGGGHMPSMYEVLGLEAEREYRASARTEANSRAEALLLSLLDENQREAYRFDGVFAVIGSHGTLYRVHRGTAGNIEWIRPDGTVGGRLCAHPDMRESWLPTADVMLAQMLALQADEREFLRIANVHAGERPALVAA